MRKKVLITSALLYANGSIHFGHIAGAYLPAECYARFKRLMGAEVLFLSGMDEYGAAVSLSADKEQRSPKEHIQYYYEEAVKTFGQFNFSFDHFSRTTWKGHDETVIQFYEDLLKNGFIEKRVTDELYSEQDQKFLADRYVEGTCPKCRYEQARGDECPKCGASYEATDLIQPKSKLSQAPLVLKKTEHSFILLDKLKEPLKAWISQKNWKPQVLNMALQYIEDAKPRSITRDLDWGIEVPGEPGKVFYVWFDAPIGYISAAKDWAEEIGKPEAWKDFWLDENTFYAQFIGKDNIPFHSVFFPAMEIGQNQPYKKVDELPANAFFHYEGKKFSKSDGWTIDLNRFFSQYSADSIRYTLAANAPETSDSEFCWKDFQSKINSDLVGKLGNFVNRSLVFLVNKLDGAIPQLISIEEKDRHYLAEIDRVTLEIQECYEGFHLRRATQKLMELATLGNVYFDEMQPWKVLKENPNRAKAILAHCLRGIQALALCGYPIIPESSEKIWMFLGFQDKIETYSWQQAMTLVPELGKKLEKPEILFKKIEDEQIKQELDLLHSSTKGA